MTEDDWEFRDGKIFFSERKILPSADTSAHGLGGYIKAAFLIWSAISSSSLNGNVPLRLFEKDLKIISPLQLIIDTICNEHRARMLAKIQNEMRKKSEFIKQVLREVRPRISETT